MKWRPITSFLLCLVIFFSIALYVYQRERLLRASSPRSSSAAAQPRIVRPPHHPIGSTSHPKATTESKPKPGVATVTQATPLSKPVANSTGNAPGKSSTATPATAPAAATTSEPAKASDTESDGSVSGATITGKVFFRGTPPSEKTIDMAADASCKAAHDTPVTTRHYVVSTNSELANVFVCVRAGSMDLRTKTPPPKKAVLDQKGCLYSPYVMGIQVNQELEVWNSDPILHNVNYAPNKNPGGNKGMPVEGMKFTLRFPTPELDAPVRFKCDVHPWMFAYVFVVPHPFFDVTRDEGTFSLKGLQAGTYSVMTWHPKAGSLTNTVTVKANDTKEISFEYK